MVSLPPQIKDATTAPESLDHDELVLLLRLGERLVSVLDMDSLLALIAEMAREVVQAETLAIPIINPDQRTFTYKAADGAYSSALYGMSFNLDEGACGWVLTHQKALLFGEDTDFSMDSSVQWERGMASCVLVPLICRGKIIGGLSAMGKSGGAGFTFRDLGVLTLFANHASIAIDNARLFQKLGDEEARLRLVLNSTGEGICGMDNDGLCTFANAGALRILGYDHEAEIIGTDLHDVIHYRHPDGRVYPRQDCAIHRSISAGQSYHSSQEWYWRKDGSGFPAEAWVHPSIKNGKAVGVVMTFTDITERMRAEEQIKDLAYFDPLTKLPNRRLLMDRFSQAIIASNRSQHYCVLMILDLDHFKNINDTLGHVVGDNRLLEVASRIVRCVRQEDTVARFGGDEFVILVEDLGADAILAAAQAERIAEKIRTEINQPYAESQDRQSLHTSTSIGLTLFCGAHMDVDELLKQADVALYQAKAAGRNTIRFFSPEMQARIEARAEMEAALRYGLEHDEFSLFYQPQVDQSGRLIGAEALLRWRSGGQNIISPDQFIPLAEETGLIIPLGLWVMRTACDQIKTWSGDSATQDLQISVNVSSHQFHQSDFVEMVRECVSRSGANPKRLKLELTESVVLENVEDVIWRMRQIEEMGIMFSLDDFGTGYSSLSYLKRLPLHQVKIDQSFVRDIAVDSNDAAIVRAIIGMSQSLGLEVIAEGVETGVQLQFLKDSGCLHYQGYFFGKPRPIDEWQQ